jgi:hypothetical protein
MANDFSGLPMVLDGTMASGYQTLIGGVPNNLKIYPRIIHWDGADLAAGDTFEIDDSAGNILFTATCPANGQGQYFDVAEGVRWEAQWQLVTLAHGKLYIWYTT